MCKGRGDITSMLQLNWYKLHYKYLNIINIYLFLCWIFIKERLSKMSLESWEQFIFQVIRNWIPNFYAMETNYAKFVLMSQTLNVEVME